MKTLEDLCESVHILRKHDAIASWCLLRAGLTKREREILRLLAEDYNLGSIATEPQLSYATVRNHVQHILSKLGVHSIMEAVAHHLVVE